MGRWHNKDTSRESYRKYKNKTYTEPFFARVFRVIIDSGIPIQNILKAVFLGYTFGVISTGVWYNFFSDVKVNVFRWICFVIVGYVVLILSYSKDIRCTATVAIPTLCSTKGRSLIVAAAFFVAATGPTMNIIKNVDVMVESLSCGQMQLKQALSDVLDILKQPLVAIKEAIRNVIKELRKVVLKVEAILLRISALVSVLLIGIKKAFGWLENVVKMCNTKFGTPYERCMNVSKVAMQDCLEKLGPIGGLCHLTHIFSAICYAAKIVDVICVLVEFVDYSVIDTVTAGLEEFIKEIKNLFDASITFKHDFYFQTTSSKELDQIKRDIMDDVHRKFKVFFIIFGWLDVISLLLVLLIVMKAIYFRLKYILNPAYHNYYITYELVQIDEQRRNLQMETILPLTFLESLQYPGLSDCRLSRKEWLEVAQSSTFLILSSIQLFSICFADYSLFTILAIISFYGHKELGLEVPPFVTVNVEGGGFVGEIFRGIVRAFEPISQNYTIDSKLCLPNPSVPNFTNYYMIAIILLMAWIFLFCQPYGLRLRHIIMRLFYPEVAKQRAIWLYNKILLDRITFIKLARRKARLLCTKNSTQDNFSFLDWFRARTERCSICRFLLGLSSKDKCLLCATPLDNDKRIKCRTVTCSAIYCKTCFRESFDMCCICNNPVEYGDFSDISQVEDSSDDIDAVHNDEIEDYYF